jgi:hypothetical protein
LFAAYAQEVVSWMDFAAVRPDLAEAGRGLLYQPGVGLAYLASVRRDGGPRVHPMCPILDSEGLFAFIVPSPKRADLLRDGRYSMHSFPRPDNEDALYLSGTAHLVDDPEVRSRLSELFVSERKALGVPAPSRDEVLFRFAIASCLLTRTTGHGDPNPVHTVWRAPSDNVTPIDPEIRRVLEEFSGDPMAFATEIVQLRAELQVVARVGEGRQEVILPPPPIPPDAPPPARLGG